MAKQENPPFERGQTFYGSATPPDATSNAQLEGKEWVFEDKDYSKTPPVIRTNRYVKCRVVRNVSGISLLPSRLANLQAGTAPTYGSKVDGYCNVASGRGYPIDEFLASTGVQNNDLFYIVVDGPASCLTDLAALNPAIVPGDYIYAQAGATTQATTAGRVVQGTTGGAGAITNPSLFFIGNALSAATTNNTNTNVLVEVRHFGGL